MELLQNNLMKVNKLLVNLGEIVSTDGTAVANTISSIATGIHNESNVAAKLIADDVVVKSIPILKGVAEVSKTVVDGTTHASEIVVHHFSMWGAEAAQDVGTITNAAGNIICDVGHLDIGAAVCEIKNCLGVMVERDQQYLKAHIAHDLELLQLPVKTIANSVIDVSKPLLGDNIVTNSPSLLDDAQYFVFENLIHDQVISPVLDGWAKENNEIFGEQLGQLSHSDMGMGFSNENNHHHSNMEIMVIGIPNSDPAVIHHC
ncbi:hypothetical protein ACTVKO_23090 [Serratia nevei]|uniref:hypothetical protein n=1 Tax=Serratia nevei TaxID=2703794 RepID=UPI003FA6DB29